MQGPVDTKLARRLAELRRNSNLSLAKLADAVGVTKATIWNYEHALTHIPAERLAAMAGAMGIEERHLHMEPGAPLPKVSFRSAAKTATPQDWESRITQGFLVPFDIALSE
jgi:transcriptional regulator with XRE-family HTH domain